MFQIQTLDICYLFGLGFTYLFVSTGQAKQLAQLLDEDPRLMERREQCAKRLELYKSARHEIDSISWIG